MSQNNISVTISKDCEVITLKVLPIDPGGGVLTLTGAHNGSALNFTPNTFPNPVAGQMISLTFTADQLNSAGSELSGIYIFTAHQGTFKVSGGVVAACSLQCCIANEINEYMACPCDPTKSPKLEKATKVFLLAEGAQADLSATIPNPDNAIAKFNKAVSLCNSSCGCGC